MGKKITALEEISDQELDHVTGGSGLEGFQPITDIFLAYARKPQTPQEPQGGSCSVQDVMNDRCQFTNELK